MKEIIIVLFLTGCVPSHRPEKLKEYDKLFAQCKQDCAPRVSKNIWNEMTNTYDCECEP